MATHSCVCFVVVVSFLCCSGVQGDIGTLRHCEMITTVFLGHPSPQSPLGAVLNYTAQFY